MSDWLRWTALVSVGETLGLTLSLGIMGIAIAWPPTYDPVLATIWALGLAMIGGSAEGVLYGGAQALVLRSRLPGLHVERFIGASAATGSLCWLLGMLPSQIMGLMEESGSADAAPMAEPPLALVVLAAAVMGAILGLILATGPALVLRPVMKHVGDWFVAHSVGWALGMATVFLVLGLVPQDAAWQIWLGTAVAAAATTSVVVAGCTGLWLPRFVPTSAAASSGRTG